MCEGENPEEVGEETSETTEEIMEEVLESARKPSKGWRYVLASAVAGLIAGGAPHLFQYIDAHTERVKAETTADLLAAEKLANEDAYKEVSEVLASHADDITANKEALQKLQELRISVAVLEEWRKHADEQIARRHAVAPAAPKPAEVARGLDIELGSEEPEPAARAAGKRPEVKKDDPRVQQLKIQLYEGK